MVRLLVYEAIPMDGHAILKVSAELTFCRAISFDLNALLLTLMEHFTKQSLATESGTESRAAESDFYVET
jgi:hypothetical protein